MNGHWLIGPEFAARAARPPTAPKTGRAPADAKILETQAAGIIHQATMLTIR